ncbi:E3 ubiquitin/ISG15 ligase TRIM25-like [Dendropsophus ebraccatus]|uniref:E3 ubiquitin/ISG15 ligase TRIM25-like n=1 Tax=Dendropsophus ebraccatus TaxID=150705 RepID=UPI0038315A80
MASADLRDELLCSICLNIYTDPATLRCGHNFCRGCIDQVLDTQDESGVYSCPECRKRFSVRPTLQRNITLCNVAERLRSTQPHQEEITGICCTYCIHSPVPAVRSCLLCEASLCDDHLRVHSKSPEHVLTDPSTSLEKRKCSVHKKVLEYYCTEDAACICVSCRLDGKHQGHRVEMLDEASEKKKEKLRNALQKLMTKREKTEEKVQSVLERRRKAQEKASGEAERVTALFIDIRRRLDDLEKRVLKEISRQKEQLSLSLSDAIQKLEIKKAKLSRRMRHIEELCNMADPLTVLQDPETGDLCDPEKKGGDEDPGAHDGSDEDPEGHDGGDEDTGAHDGSDEDPGGHDGGDEDTGGPDGGDEDTGGPDGGDEDTGAHDGGDEDTGGHDDVDVDVITGMLQAGISDIMAYIQTISLTKLKAMMPQPSSVRSQPSHTQASSVSSTEYGGDVIIGRTGGAAGQGGIYGEGPAHILLDVNTADNNVFISDDLKSATRTKVKENRPETAERFRYCPQVMSIRRFSSGRHYWDVDINVSVWWMVGMCYPSIDRRGEYSAIGHNNKSWCLCRRRWCNTQYLVIHDSTEIQLPHQISSNRFRICLDYEAGRLSFYELCDPIRHLHTFTATFTEPLHAALYVWEGDIKISGRAAAVRQHRHRGNLPRDR